ncbi:MAG: metallophosphoesterase family protein [Dehalococcoidia bacterium]|nr:metallophosphoesterase family protein [Dehalococcoidia bacterium]MDD5493474.1 metallophosphoesterase family protein [Dehalococcoidia bacterium]
MKYLVVADIHSNLEAFQAVLDDVNENYGGFDHIWCLGDIVGYGPSPSQCIKLLHEFDYTCVCGNHDQAAVGKLDTSDFNADAASANEWTARQLSEDERQFLLDLPEVVIEGEFTIVHGSPRAPVWEYITSALSAAESFRHFDTKYCLVGHTHVPFVFEQDEVSVNEGYLGSGDMLVLGGNRLIINPGGVGQPRDRDPRASYAVYDSEKNIVYHYRVSYDVSATQEKMEEAGLPGFLISRLGWGV